jgi:(p)ppGpp synthase/HD superfamily hydrolase
MPPSQWSPKDYTAAYWFAARAHQGQTMPGTELPYLIHLSLVSMEVIAALRAEPGRDETLAVKCSLLHDVIEDTPVTYGQIEEVFSTAVAASVLALSKDPHLAKPLQMPDSLRRIRQQPPEVWMVKLADRIVNLQQPRPDWSAERIRAYQAEGQDILSALEDASPALAARLRHTIEHYQDYLNSSVRPK